MKILVDELPATCAGCEYCADGMMMTPLGVPKPVNACVLQQLVPPKSPDDIPPTIDKNKTPLENNCPCHSEKISTATTPEKTSTALTSGITKSGIII